MKHIIEIEVDDNLDLERLYTVISDALYYPENVTQQDNDLILSIINKLQENKVNHV